MTSPVLTPCAVRLREEDRDRFLLSLFVPPSGRAGLWALYALDLELEAIAARSSDPILRLVRLQWWRESLSRLVHEPGHSAPKSAHPVLVDLQRGLPEVCRTTRFFEPLLLSHEARLEHAALSSPESLREAYATRETILTRMIRDCTAPMEEWELAAVCAQGWGAIRAWRAGHALTPSSYDMEKYCRDIRVLFVDHLDRSNLTPPFLRAMAALTWQYLNHLERYKEKGLQHLLHYPPPFSALRLWARVYLRKTY